MKVKINQKQDRSLLEEHAKSSFNFGLVGKNELYIAITFLIIGTVISLFLTSNRLVGLPLIAIGLLEIIKFPTREKRWVKKKEKEKIFNKDMTFEILDNTLIVKYDKESKTHLFSKMRECIISETGILFKISISEYYYISFKSLEGDIKKSDLINHLKSQFQRGKIKEKQTVKSK